VHRTRRIGVCVLSALAISGLASAAVAAPAGSKPKPPRAGTYVLHDVNTPSQYSHASMKLRKKSGKLTLTSVGWTEKASLATDTNGICPKGKYSIKTARPVRLELNGGSHHQKQWTVGTHRKSGTTGVKVKIVQPDGSVKKGKLLALFDEHGKPLSGQHVNYSGGMVTNADGSCGFSFKFKS
jgi:hypothetical protein